MERTAEALNWLEEVNDLLEPVVDASTSYFIYLIPVLIVFMWVPTIINFINFVTSSGSDSPEHEDGHIAEEMSELKTGVEEQEIMDETTVADVIRMTIEKGDL